MSAVTYRLTICDCDNGNHIADLPVYILNHSPVVELPDGPPGGMPDNVQVDLFVEIDGSDVLLMSLQDDAALGDALALFRAARVPNLNTTTINITGDWVEVAD